MSDHHGQFVWCELMTKDLDAAERFYREAIGWTTADAGAQHVRYTILHAGQVPMGGMVQMPPEGAEKPTGWIGYIGVDDVDDMAARVTAAGGAVHRAPDDIPDVGRFAVVADPQGAAFVLFKPLPGGPEQPAGATPGRVGWRELYVDDWPSAFDFYAGLFGWNKVQAIDMGSMGTYQIFATPGLPPGQMTGGMMTKPPMAPKPGWLYYFIVEAVDAAIARTQAAGGTLVHGPQQVPGGSWIAQFADPEGSMFALVGPTR